MQKIILPFVICLLPGFSFGQMEDTATTTKYIPKEIIYSYLLGNKSILVKGLQYGERKDIVMINLHDDETTSVEAAKFVLETTGGLLLKIKNNNERIISFVLHGKNYSFDPNRMFTKKGITASLKKSNRYSSLAAHKIEGFAKFVLDKIPEKNKTLIALHNNDDENYSIESYGAGGDYFQDVEDLHIDISQDKDNFFLTTDRSLYDNCMVAGYNSVLQQNKKARDDGSLSVYYGRKKRSYVNVEAELEQTSIQIEMLRTVLIFVKKLQVSK